MQVRIKKRNHGTSLVVEEKACRKLLSIGIDVAVRAPV